MTRGEPKRTEFYSKKDIKEAITNFTQEKALLEGEHDVQEAQDGQYLGTPSTVDSSDLDLSGINLTSIDLKNTKGWSQQNEQDKTPQAEPTLEVAIASGGHKGEIKEAEAVNLKAEGASILEDAAKMVRAKIEAGTDANELAENYSFQLEDLAEDLKYAIEDGQDTIASQIKMDQERITAQLNEAKRLAA